MAYAWLVMLLAAGGEPWPPGLAALTARMLVDPDVPRGLVVTSEPYRYPLGLIENSPAPREPVEQLDPWWVELGLANRQDTHHPGALAMDPVTSELLRFRAPRPRLQPMASPSLEACLRTAGRFAARWFPVTPGEPIDLQLPRRPLTLGDDGTVGFTFVAVQRGCTSRGSLRIDVRLLDALVVGCAYSPSRLAVPSEPVLSEAAAREQALSLLRQLDLRPLEVIGVDRSVSGHGRPDRELCSASVEVVLAEPLGSPEGRGTPVASVGLDLFDGRPRTLALGHASPEYLAVRRGTRLGLSRPYSELSDRAPCWFRAADGTEWIGFVSNRSRSGVPSWGDDETVMLIRPDGTDPRCLRRGPAEWYDAPVAGGGWLTAGRRAGEASLIDLTTGQERALGGRDRDFVSAFVDAGGGLLLLTAWHVGADRTAVYSLRPRGEDSRRPRRIARVPGGLSAAVIPPASEFAYLLRDGRPQELWRVALAGDGDPELVLDGLAESRGLAPFPDGRLLLRHEVGGSIVDLDTRTVAPLDLPPLRDPELGPASRRLRVEDLTASPDGRWLLFSAIRPVRADPDDGPRYLYACALDGLGLRRVTPLDDAVVPAWRYSATGRPAYPDGVDVGLCVDWEPYLVDSPDWRHVELPGRRRGISARWPR